MWDVEVYVGGKLVTVITVSAKTAPDASTEAFKSVNVKVKKVLPKRKK